MKAEAIQLLDNNVDYFHGIAKFLKLDTKEKIDKLDYSTICNFCSWKDKFQNGKHIYNQSL